MTQYKGSDKFLAFKKQWDTLADNIKELGAQLPTSKNKSILLNNLIIALHAFDDHIKLMIKEFPEYYQEHKQFLDDLLEANDNYIIASHKDLSKYKN